MKAKLVSLFAIMFSCILSLFGQQASMNPNLISGQVKYYHSIDVALSDTGNIGSSQVWDFSSHSYNSNLNEMTCRDLTPSENTSYPGANLALEHSDGRITYRLQSSDSMSIVATQNSTGIISQFSNFETRFKFPLIFNSAYEDTFSYEYMSGITPVEVKGVSNWAISGQGELKTPLNNYDSTYKVTYIRHLVFYVNGSIYQEVNHTNVTWYSTDNNFSLLTINYSDYNNEIEGIFMASDSFTSIENIEDESNLIFPNPASDKVNISAKIEEYELFDSAGNKITEGNSSSLSVSNLPDGFYWLKVTIDDREKMLKIVKQH